MSTEPLNATPTPAPTAFTPADAARYAALFAAAAVNNGHDVNAPPRPMLSRDADGMYWMARYVERAEHVARMLLVNSNTLVDVGDLAPALQQRQWLAVLETFRVTTAVPDDDDLRRFITQHMTFNHDNPNSLINCLSRARENARAIRENISAEMWENLNALYWNICADDAVQRFEESPDEFFRAIMTGSFLFQGLTDQTLGHEQRWLFTQVGKYLERIDVTARIIETKFNILVGTESTIEAPIRNIQWMAVLRSCCSIEAFRRSFVGDLDPQRVAAFLILQRNFPRSIRYCVERAYEAVADIRRGVNLRTIDPAERILGRLSAQLEYAESSEIAAEGLPSYLAKIQNAVSNTAIAVQKAYFLQ